MSRLVPLNDDTRQDHGSTESGRSAAAVRNRAARDPLTSCATGNASAFTELYCSYSRALYGYLLTLTHDRIHAEDLLQVTMEKAYRFRHTYVPRDNPLSWLLAIARHAFLDELRTRRDVLTRSGALPESAQSIPSSSTELALAVRQALAALPPGQREGVLLTKLLGYTSEQAAAALGITQSALKARVHRSSQRLRTMLRA
ncbi:MAG: RNA polymerase sigma factor [Polyangiaceae bacterium]|nr:RNA polymerase sigma factor [Polyangiaceae bacterium]